MPTFIREIAMNTETTPHLAVRPVHREYVHALYERGEIRLSGPLAGDAGAVIVYEAPSLDAARALIAADPYVEAGVVDEVSLREWTVVVPTSA